MYWLPGIGATATRGKKAVITRRARSDRRSDSLEKIRLSLYASFVVLAYYLSYIYPSLSLSLFPLMSQLDMNNGTWSTLQHKNMNRIRRNKKFSDKDSCAECKWQGQKPATSKGVILHDTDVDLLYILFYLTALLYRVRRKQAASRSIQLVIPIVIVMYK